MIQEASGRQKKEEVKPVGVDGVKE